MADASSRSAPISVEDLDRARSLARALLNIEAVSLRPHDPFTWSSGRVAPIYCDNRRTLAHPRIRRVIAEGFADIIRDSTSGSLTIAGTATAGIPHAAWLAEQLEAPMAYVRSSAKEHGQGRRIEGTRLNADDAVIIVEDLVSTGASALGAVSAVQETGATVRAVLTIFTYQLDVATAAFRDAEVPCHALTDFHVLLETARRHRAFSEEDFSILKAWREDPTAWSDEHDGAG
ncbi:MAG: orotate phosphoribosyltransferase [Salinibacter sp.]|uniref:orotate phosphoribosyltransferase n=1 Tax=Salinibacter sp. TaxID=2065818 RepID=UPI0035D47B97